MSDAIKYWSDEVAATLVKQDRGFVISTGITPSGEIHVGHLREVVTAHAVFCSLRDRGVAADFHYVCDNLDPLRKVYSFLDEAKYAPFVGKPISRVPSPDDVAPSYAEYFLKPFLSALENLGMSPRVVFADKMYAQEKFAQTVLKALERRDVIADILHRSTGKKIDSSWSPYTPFVDEAKPGDPILVTGYDAERMTVSYRLVDGKEGEVSIQGGGKLTWRVDWPARWSYLGVTMEPFGKDHATRGGSYDTGALISREVFDYEPPVPVTYEWIGLKGGGDMSSSKGNVISLYDITQVAPPEVLRYFILRSNPTKKLTFDPGLPLLSLIDEYDKALDKMNAEMSDENLSSDESKGNLGARAISLAQLEGAVVLGIPFRHLVTLLQICGDDLNAVRERLEAAGYRVPNDNVLASRLGYVREWLSRYAPADVKFAVQNELPDAVAELAEDQKKALGLLADKIENLADYTPESIHQEVYAVKEELAMQPKEVFEAIYLSVLGQRRGPRVGMFLASLKPDWLVQRFGVAKQ